MYHIFIIVSVIIILLVFINYITKKRTKLKKNNDYIYLNKLNDKINSKKYIDLNRLDTQLDKSNINKDCKISTNINSYQCYITQSDLCPMSSYKQCDNHYDYKSFPPNLKNNCRELNNRDTSSYLLSQNCLLKNKDCYQWKQLLKKDTIVYPNFYPRVNTWKSSISTFQV